MDKQINNNNSVNVAVSKSVAEAASMIYKLQDFFDVEDKNEIYLEDSDEIFCKLINAVQGMLGCEAYWEIGKKNEK